MIGLRMKHLKRRETRKQAKAAFKMFRESHQNQEWYLAWCDESQYGQCSTQTQASRMSYGQCTTQTQTSRMNYGQCSTQTQTSRIPTINIHIYFLGLNCTILRKKLRKISIISTNNRYLQHIDHRFLTYSNLKMEQNLLPPCG